MRRLRIAVAALALLLAAHASAHDTWLLGRVVEVDGSPQLQFDLTSGMSFPQAETAIAPDRIARAEVRVGQQHLPLAPSTNGASLRLSATGVARGLALATVVLAPRTLELDPAQVEEYLAELGPDPSVRAAYQRNGRWREHYRKNATALVQVGERGGPTTPQGLPLELVALDDPGTLRVGSALRACLYANGKAVVDHRVGLVGADDPTLRWSRTDGDGCVRFELSLPGRYMLRAIQLEAARSTDLDWRSEFATLSLEVPH